MSETNNTSNGHKPTKEFAALLIEHQHAIYVFIRSMIYSPDDAKDILQNVNIIVLKKHDQFEMGTSFKSWAFRIARFECLVFLREYKKNNLSSLDTGILETLADEVEENANSLQPILLALRKCMGTLPPTSQNMLHLHYTKSIPIEKAAHQMETTTTAFKQKLYRIRQTLKECVANRLKNSSLPFNRK